jgi:hypothetical protein
MCEWILFEDNNYPDDDREVLLYIENDCAVYFGYCDEQQNPCRRQWYFNVDGDWHDIHDAEIVCYLEYPMIPAELLEKAKNMMDR